ncbi:hypothetical protein EPA93_37575 [Ktedonosporobacter rubrisoli]|uniref:Orotate phosphoribosyltransferase n=1 Tax=Ktedonosporobacter rubrisoli TaxID=2509675 RepID=A0A4P6K0P4_KTERU|nr:phosphoribosyltransferase family protein [Ktedonosporobacter rubrisoli]QBD81383.1 hypothetical protein EPA93_37575 [Ktedonosporobacter rubrisoli]
MILADHSMTEHSKASGPHLSVGLRKMLKEAINEVSPIVYRPRASAVAEALLQARAYSVAVGRPPEEWFHWKCGIIAPCGCNCRVVNGFPACRRLIDRALVKAVLASFPEVDYIVGVANAGIPWAKSLAERLNQPLAYVRTAAKGMSHERLVECMPTGGKRAVIVEDALVSGESTLKVINALKKETDLQIAGIQSIVNWNFPSMRTLLRGYTVRTLTSYPFILAGAFARRLIDEEGFAQLLAFYRDPEANCWLNYYKDWLPQRE